MPKYLDLAGVTYLWGKVKDLFVQKEAGKGLSTNDFSTAEKDKLKGLTNYSHPSYTAKASGLYKVTVDSTGHISGAAEVSKADITALGIPGQDTNTTYPISSNTLDGLMSKEMNSKVDGIESGAQVNKIENISVNNVTLTISGKKVNISVPTKVSQLSNDNAYQTSAEVIAAINTALGNFVGIKFEIISTLPSTGADGTFYLKPNNGSGTNIYDEYIYVNSKWEMIGTTQVDLSGYLKKTDITTITTAEIDTIIGA